LDWAAASAVVDEIISVVSAFEPAAGPFVELIDFADNEGIIGPRTSAKLAADLVDWKSRAEAHAAAFENEDEGRFFLDCYAEWTRAFDLAKNGGVVVSQ